MGPFKNMSRLKGRGGVGVRWGVTEGPMKLYNDVTFS